METTSYNLPCIGVLTLNPSSQIINYVNSNNYTAIPDTFSQPDLKSILSKSTFIDLNYINFVKLGGMEPVPLLLDISDDETIEQLESLNGVLLTGGAEPLYTDYEFQSESATHYQKRVKLIIDNAKKINDNGRFFIVYSICLGYESILCAENDNKNMLKVVDHQVKTYETNIILGNADQTVYGQYLGDNLKLLEQPINYFYHKYGVLLEDFYEYKNVSDKMRAFSYIHLNNGFNVLTGAEYIDYPIYLVLFHPEKIMKIDDPQKEELRLLSQQLHAKFMKVQIKKSGAEPLKGISKKQVVELIFPNDYGVRYIYTKEE